ncbi:ATP-binding protein [Clostridium nigeriense]|uniref:sensor histidine kinase n=1 Tax=Clostridium nigeriense TaxID=1805470 RepID=UPI003D33198E
MIKGMINYRYRGLMAHMFAPIILVLTILKIIFNMTEEYISITRILCLSISVLIFIISIVKVNNKEKGILRYYGAGCFFISILRFIDIEVSKYIMNINIIMTFTQLITYLELLNSILSIYFYYKNYSLKRLNSIFIILIPIGYFILINEGKVLYYLSWICTNIKGIIINQIAIFILFIIVLNLYRKIGTKEKDNWIVFFSFLILLSNSFSCISRILNLELTFLIWLTKLLAYFIAYNKFEESLLFNAYSSAYENLNKAKETKKNLNKNLKRREKELKELNLVLEKSEKKYYDVVHAFSKGLLLFENDILTYSNNYEETYYNENDEFNFEGKFFTLNSILNKITGNEYPNEMDINEFTTEIEITNTDDEKRVIEIYLMKIYGNKKILVFNDITEIFNKREEIIKIENKITEENIKEEFYSNISHELRTPINVIYSALQLNDIYLQNKELNKISKNNDIIRQNCLRLIRTINNFIDSNKLSEGYLDMDCKYYNLVDIIENVVLSCDFYMKLKKTNLIYDPQYEEIYLYCDKNHIERIMLNILSNSLKYGKENGNIYVTVKIYRNEKIIIEVTNDAEAIPEDKRNVIFDKFTKVNTSLNRPSEGSGLGLYLTKGLVELHSGEISISAGREYGNIFKIVLPYNKSIEENITLKNNNIEINELQQKIDIEFSDIYF